MRCRGRCLENGELHDAIDPIARPAAFHLLASLHGFALCDRRHLHVNRAGKDHFFLVHAVVKAHGTAPNIAQMGPLIAISLLQCTGQIVQVDVGKFVGLSIGRR